MNITDNSLKSFVLCGCAALLATGLTGCQSPYRSDQGALLGGITGAGVGALIGEAVDNPLAGAVVGAGVGSFTGAVIGENLDQIEAQNRAEIEARLGRPVSPGAVSMQDVIAMTQNGVESQIIVNHVNNHGVARVLQTQDLIYLKNNGVDAQVIAAMQRPPAPLAVVHAPPRPANVIVEEHYYSDPWHGPHRRFRRHRRHRHGHHEPRVSWGLSFSSRD